MLEKFPTNFRNFLFVIIGINIFSLGFRKVFNGVVRNTQDQVLITLHKYCNVTLHSLKCIIRKRKYVITDTPHKLKPRPWHTQCIPYLIGYNSVNPFLLDGSIYIIKDEYYQKYVELLYYLLQPNVNYMIVVLWFVLHLLQGTRQERYTLWRNITYRVHRCVTFITHYII